ncbi:hypothetical protein ACTFIU_011208 [Dictyostelium citrinum]
MSLPIYLQKYIVKILCIHIDYGNGIMGGFDDYREGEQKIKKLMITIALVSKEWFKTLSDNLTISVDFNYKEKGKDQYSIIKSDNIKTLKLHYQHDTQQFYVMDSGGFQIELPIEIVNDKIMKLSTMEGTNFKYLKIRNVKHQSEIDVLDKLYQLSICEFSINSNINLEKINDLKRTVSNMLILLVHETASFEIIQDVLVPYAKRYFNFSIIDILSSYDDGGNKINYLSNLLRYSQPKISISELDTLIKSSPKLNHISIGICLNSFLYYLYTEIKQQQQQQQQHQIEKEDLIPIYYSQKICSCNSLFFHESRDGKLMKENEKSIKFNNYYSSIIKYLNENENSINQFRIYNDCLHYYKYSMFEFLKAPTFLIDKFVSFISSFKSLKIFEVHFFNKQLINQIVIKNQNITHYRITLPYEIISQEDALEYSNEILLNNPHIIEFKIINVNKKN